MDVMRSSCIHKQTEVEEKCAIKVDILIQVALYCTRLVGKLVTTALVTSVH